MKYAVVIWLDQTIGYLSEEGDGDVTIVHREAKLWDDKVEAQAIGEKEGRYFIQVEEIPDVAEFQSRPDTW